MRAFLLTALLMFALPVGAAAQSLHIRDATYTAKDGRRCNPSNLVRSACEGKANCEIEAGNRLCGDPAKATYKELVVSYECGGRRGEARVPEGEEMRLSCSDVALSAGVSPLHIRSASYRAKDGRRCDPGGAVRSACEGQGNCEIDAGNQLCGDPAKGTYKELVVGYDCAGRRQEARVAEGQRMSLSCSGDSASVPSSGAGGPLHIRSASYRAPDGRHCDPGRRVRAACEGKATCGIEAGNRLCGDPAKSVVKELVVSYECAGRRNQARVAEGQQMTLSCSDDSLSAAGSGDAGPLHIRSASYRAMDGRRCDPGRQVRAACEGKANCEIEAGNRLCGDPAKSAYKELVVSYECAGRRHEARVAEGQQMSLSCGGDVATSAPWSNPGLPLQISDASYQTRDGRSCNAGNRIRATCQGQRNCSVEANDRLCGDPAQSAYKELVVGYSCGGGRLEARVPEGRSANLVCN